MRFYYSPAGYQKGVSKLYKKFPELKRQQIRRWLDRQPVYQLYRPKPKNIKFPHYNQDKPNHTHQVDILYLSHDTVGKSKYKYVLSVIDIASRYKQAEPLKTKKAEETAIAIQKIYSRSLLNFPQKIMCDKGHEFMGKFLSLMKENSVTVKRSLSKKKVAFVERFNKTLAERLYTYQYDQEMKTGKTNREWVERLPDVVEAINNEETRMIGMKPIDAIKLESVPQPEYKEEEEEVFEELPLDSNVRYLYKPGEAHNDNRYRATDPIWSVDIYSIDEIRKIENQPYLYTLQNLDPERTFTREQLQVVPTDTDEDAGVL